MCVDYAKRPSRTCLLLLLDNTGCEIGGLAVVFSSVPMRYVSIFVGGRESVEWWVVEYPSGNITSLN